MDATRARAKMPATVLPAITGTLDETGGEEVALVLEEPAGDGVEKLVWLISAATLVFKFWR